MTNLSRILKHEADSLKTVALNNHRAEIRQGFAGQWEAVQQAINLLKQYTPDEVIQILRIQLQQLEAMPMDGPSRLTTFGRITGTRMALRMIQEATDDK